MHAIKEQTNLGKSETWLKLQKTSVLQKAVMLKRKLGTGSDESDADQRLNSSSAGIVKGMELIEMEQEVNKVHVWIQGSTLQWLLCMFTQKQIPLSCRNTFLELIALSVCSTGCILTFYY